MLESESRMLSDYDHTDYYPLWYPGVVGSKSLETLCATESRKRDAKRLMTMNFAV